MVEKENEQDLEFDDALINLFWKLHRFRFLQWLLLLIIRIREKMDLHKFIKKPITKEVDEMDNCHFRTLYRRNHFNDNYTDPDFLCSMQLNTNLNYYTLGETISASTRVSLHLCPCILYFTMYYHLSLSNISPETVFGISLVCLLFGYLVFQCYKLKLCSTSTECVLSPTFFTKKLSVVWSDCMASISCAAFSYLLVPILRTVTQTVDIRTVYAVCSIMFAVHLLCNDYGLNVALVSSALSMNSAIFSVICLASRLQSDEHCLALISFGVMSFICYPQWGEVILSRFQRWNSSVSLTIFVIVTFAGYSISWGVALLIIALILMIVIISPILYVCYVQYKVNIHGPWDEARPELHVDMEEIEKGFEKRKETKNSKRRESPNKHGGIEDKIKNATSTSVAKMSKVKKDEEKIAELEAKGIGLIL